MFAPTDTAFSKLPGRHTGRSAQAGKQSATGRDCFPTTSRRANSTAADLAKADEVKTLEGTEIDVEPAPTARSSRSTRRKILGSDVEATNGIIHAIDTVLQP